MDAGVPLYGTPAAEEVRKKVKGPLLIQLAELDKRVNASWPEYEADLKANKARYTMEMYAKANQPRVGEIVFHIRVLKIKFASGWIEVVAAFRDQGYFPLRCVKLALWAF
ncbi:dienelactone hydrolase family protein [Akkermansiaceae bacterium]|nr:dienelactone hydrolase family protein [Akkermansiaceae bacterium]MDB4322795.1 dienelactone hydrolase family protein [Akkermansiaceae bacterium]MDB4382424.1 dienelactone hydrolase family protein [Akkermansiaceae bacterium]MDB4393146.1 dienelactone hydrolase family protein [Akkermansiaceae bacterium]